MKRPTRRPAGKKPPFASKIAEKKQLTLESVAFGGDALTRLDGKVYFVADAIPGETVEAELLQDKERFAKARVVRRLQDAPYALTPPCKFAERCGGCQWQKVPYAMQLEWKAGFIQDALQRIGGIAAGTYDFAMQASPETYHYRNRIEVKWQILPNGSVQFGYFAKSSHDLVAIDRCLIADPLINQVLTICQTLTFPKRERIFTTSIEFQALADGQVLASGAPELQDFWQDFTQLVAADAQLSTLLLVNPSAFVPLETWEGIKFLTRGGLFQQVNLAANRFIRNWVRDFARRQKLRTVVDLYCGSGNLSLPLAQDGLQVFGVEAFGPSIEAAQYNIQMNNLHASYATGDAQDIHQLFPDLPPVELLIVDPPRRGMAEAIDPVLKLQAQSIIYVSCDPNTLARDLKQLLAQGYKLMQVMGLDFFPQSYHVETVCVLQRSI